MVFGKLLHTTRKCTKETGLREYLPQCMLGQQSKRHCSLTKISESCEIRKMLTICRAYCSTDDREEHVTERPVLTMPYPGHLDTCSGVCLLMLFIKNSLTHSDQAGTLLPSYWNLLSCEGKLGILKSKGPESKFWVLVLLFHFLGPGTGPIFFECYLLNRIMVLCFTDTQGMSLFHWGMDR